MQRYANSHATAEQYRLRNKAARREEVHKRPSTKNNDAVIDSRRRSTDSSLVFTSPTRKNAARMLFVHTFVQVCVIFVFAEPRANGLDVLWRFLDLHMERPGLDKRTWACPFSANSTSRVQDSSATCFIIGPQESDPIGMGKTSA
jgi:hypothetical protein